MKHINIFLSIIVFMVFSCSDTSQDNMFDESALIMLLDQDEAAGGWHLAAARRGDG